MNIAQSVDGEPLAADAHAPKEALCPRCGGVVELRSRRTMDREKVTYYWRHRNNRNTTCRARQRPVR